MTHRCNAPDNESTFVGYRNAIDYCYEPEADMRQRKRGQFWVATVDGETQVNYCPFCGEKAPVGVNDE